MTTLSIVIPTRDRPELLRAVLTSIQMQSRIPDEVVVSDNSRRMAQETEQVTLASGPVPISYVRPQHQLSAVEHWNFAIQQTSGDYVTALTDKMPLLSNTLQRSMDVLDQEGVDILNWPALPFVPDDSAYPMGPGEIKAPCDLVRNTRAASPFSVHDPRHVLREKADGLLSRGAQSAGLYGRGKICFGLYSRRLIERIISLSGYVCAGATHDYSCMVQGLSLADGLVELDQPGILHITLPIAMSTGSAITYESLAARDYWASVESSALGSTNEFCLVPGLYSSSHNLVSSDFQRFQVLFSLPSEINQANWLRHITGDVLNPSLRWGSDSERRQQLELLISRAREMGMEQVVGSVWATLPSRSPSVEAMRNLRGALGLRVPILRQLWAASAGRRIRRGRLLDLLAE